MKINRQLRRYYWQIRRWLPCGHKQKNRYIRELSESINAFLQQESNADFQTVLARFGSPLQIASAYVDEMDTEKLLKRLQLRRRIMTVILVGVVSGLVATIIALGIQLEMTEDMANGYAVIEIEVTDTHIEEDIP
ncbi:MAG: hypothetical protein IKW10_05830 [Oscillospiraceae bacterium]|nr:hypothetical protein [Oscillospiraceae bacterium]